MPQNYPNQMPQQFQPNQYPPIPQHQPNQYPPMPQQQPGQYPQMQQGQPGSYPTMPQQPGQCQISQVPGNYPQNQQNFHPSMPQQPQPGFVISPAIPIIGMSPASSPAMPQGYHGMSGAPGGVIINAFPNAQQFPQACPPGAGQQSHCHQVSTRWSQFCQKIG